MTALGQNLKINGDRLWDSLMEMAKIGPGVAGGATTARRSRMRMQRGERCFSPGARRQA